ncbi:MAG: transcription antitermination factor NusB [Bacteroidales bacterium]|nr:transcription antitermination factor NusB [Bacteroidales bacterium]
MISRRILRIKVMQALYAYYKNAGGASMNDIEKELHFSINKTYDLYHYMFLLIIDVCNYAQKRIDIARNKKLPSEQDLRPNTKFIDNGLIAQLRMNSQLLRYTETKKLNWANNPELIKGIYDEMSASDDYAEYMADLNQSYQSDKNFISKIYKNVIANYEPLYHALEEQSIFWNDEIEFVIGAVIKTIKKFKLPEAENAQLLSLYKNDEDKEFSKVLFRKTILKRDEYQQLIEKFSKNWDFERIAFVDILLIEMAIAEVLEFPSIPVKVTFNEYIELSKYYSTNRSNIFINGILDKIFAHLKETNQIKKQGRGLIGEE